MMKKIPLTFIHILILFGLVAVVIFYSKSMSKSQNMILKSNHELMTQPIKIDERREDSYEREW